MANSNKAKAEEVVLSEEEVKAAEAKAKAELAAKIAAEDEELVEVTLFKDNRDYKDDLPVGVNGVVINIKRGETVKIPRKYAKVIAASIDQDRDAAKKAEAKQGMVFMGEM